MKPSLTTRRLSLVLVVLSGLALGIGVSTFNYAEGLSCLSTDPAACANGRIMQALWRLDCIAAENSMGFHAPQEAARVLGEAADLARQGQVAAIRWNESR